MTHNPNGFSRLVKWLKAKNKWSLKCSYEEISFLPKPWPWFDTSGRLVVYVQMTHSEVYQINIAIMRAWLYVQKLEIILEYKWITKLWNFIYAFKPGWKQWVDAYDDRS